jgi:hypothetical protein
MLYPLKYASQPLAAYNIKLKDNSFLIESCCELNAVDLKALSNARLGLGYKTKVECHKKPSSRTSPKQRRNLGTVKVIDLWILVE